MTTNMTVVEAKRKCIEEIERCLMVASKHYNINIPHVVISWSNRMTASGGNAKCKFLINGKTGVVNVYDLRISLSIPYLMGDMVKFIDEVPAHEAAHIIDYVYNKRSSKHGYQWQSIMRVLGKEPNRTHNMNCAVERKTRKTVEATCPCNTKFMITPYKASKIRFLSCRKCHGQLKLVAPQWGIEDEIRMNNAEMEIQSALGQL